MSDEQKTKSGELGSPFAELLMRKGPLDGDEQRLISQMLTRATQWGQLPDTGFQVMGVLEDHTGSLETATQDSLTKLRQELARIKQLQGSDVTVTTTAAIEAAYGEFERDKTRDSLNALFAFQGNAITRFVETWHNRNANWVERHFAGKRTIPHKKDEAPLVYDGDEDETGRPVGFTYHLENQRVAGERSRNVVVVDSFEVDLLKPYKHEISPRLEIIFNQGHISNIAIRWDIYPRLSEKDYPTLYAFWEANYDSRLLPPYIGVLDSRVFGLSFNVPDAMHLNDFSFFRVEPDDSGMRKRKAVLDETTNWYKTDGNSLTSVGDYAQMIYEAMSLLPTQALLLPFREPKDLSEASFSLDTQ